MAQERTRAGRSRDPRAGPWGPAGRKGHAVSDDGGIPAPTLPEAPNWSINRLPTCARLWSVACGPGAWRAGRGGPTTALEDGLSTAVSFLQGVGRLGPGTLRAPGHSLHQSVPRTVGGAASFLQLPPCGEKELTPRRPAAGPHPCIVMPPSAQNYLQFPKQNTRLAWRLFFLARFLLKNKEQENHCTSVLSLKLIGNKKHKPECAPTHTPKATVILHLFGNNNLKSPHFHLLGQ